MAGLLVDGVVGLKDLAAEETVERAVELIVAGFGDDIEGGAFAAAVLCREAVGADLELLRRLRGGVA